MRSKGKDLSRAKEGAMATERERDVRPADEGGESGEPKPQQDPDPETTEGRPDRPRVPGPEEDIHDS